MNEAAILCYRESPLWTTDSEAQTQGRKRGPGLRTGPRGGDHWRAAVWRETRREQNRLEALPHPGREVTDDTAVEEGAEEQVRIQWNREEKQEMRKGVVGEEGRHKRTELWREPENGVEEPSRKRHQPAREVWSPENSDPALPRLHGTFSLWSSTVSVAILLPLHSARPPPAASTSGSSRLGAYSHCRPIVGALTAASYYQRSPLVYSWRRPHSSKRLSPPLSKGGTWRRAGSAPSERRKWWPIVRPRGGSPANEWWRRWPCLTNRESADGRGSCFLETAGVEASAAPRPGRASEAGR